MGAFILLVNLVICFLIAYYAGSKRKIGFGWSLFFCIFLSPIIGGIITALSPRKFDEPSKNENI